MLSNSFHAGAELATIASEPEIDSANVLMGAMRHIVTLRANGHRGPLPEGPVRALAVDALSAPCHGDPVLETLRDMTVIHVHGWQGQSAAVQRLARSAENTCAQEFELCQRRLSGEQKRDVRSYMRYLSPALMPATSRASNVLPMRKPQ